jgi:homoserine O-acetyltransferase
MTMLRLAPRWRHPPLQPGWIDSPHQSIVLGDLPLESGEVIGDFALNYVTHGTRAPADDNVILVLTAIGSTHHRLDFLIGPGRPLDPDRHFIICVDAIGNGLTTSPSNSAAQPDLAFPRFSIRDMVASQRRLLDALGISRLGAVVGASMGGMQALQWGVSAPALVRGIVALVPMARTRPWSAAMNEVARRILMVDPGWPSGPYGAGFDAWAALTRVITNRPPGALEGMAAAAIPGLVTEVIAMMRRIGPDPLDWAYRSLRCARCRDHARIWWRHRGGAAHHSGPDAAAGAGARSLQSDRRCGGSRSADSGSHAGASGRQRRSRGCSRYVATTRRHQSRH